VIRRYRRRVTEDGEVLFSLLGQGGDGIRVVAGGPYTPSAADLEARSWLRAYIEVNARPFAGTLETVFTPEDLAEWRNVPEPLPEGRSLTVGGDRAPEVRLTRDGPVVEVAVTPSGDDPWPLLRFLVFADGL